MGGLRSGFEIGQVHLSIHPPQDSFSFFSAFTGTLLSAINTLIFPSKPSVSKIEGITFHFIGSYK